MKFGEGFFIGLTALCTNKMRSLLMMLGIVVGVASVLAMIAIGDGAKLLVLEDLKKLGGANHFRLYRNDWIEKDGRWERNRSGEYFKYEDVLAIEAECPSVAGAWPRINYYNILVLAECTTDCCIHDWFADVSGRVLIYCSIPLAIDVAS